MKNYRFTIYVNGNGNTPDEGWADAMEHFNPEEEETPMSYSEEEIEEEDET